MPRRPLQPGHAPENVYSDSPDEIEEERRRRRRPMPPEPEVAPVVHRRMPPPPGNPPRTPPARQPAALPGALSPEEQPPRLPPPRGGAAAAALAEPPPSPRLRPPRRSIAVNRELPPIPPAVTEGAAAAATQKPKSGMLKLFRPSKKLQSRPLPPQPFPEELGSDDSVAAPLLPPPRNLPASKRPGSLMVPPPRHPELVPRRSQTPPADEPLCQVLTDFESLRATKNTDVKTAPAPEALYATVNKKPPPLPPRPNLDTFLSLDENRSEMGLEDVLEFVNTFQRPSSTQVDSDVTLRRSVSWQPEGLQDTTEVNGQTESASQQGPLTSPTAFNYSCQDHTAVYSKVSSSLKTQKNPQASSSSQIRPSTDRMSMASGQIRTVVKSVEEIEEEIMEELITEEFLREVPDFSQLEMEDLMDLLFSDQLESSAVAGDEVQEETVVEEEMYDNFDVVWDSIYENTAVAPATHVGELPVELLEQVFSYLPVHDQMCVVPEVCHSWRMVAAAQSLCGTLDFSGTAWYWLWHERRSEKVQRFLSFLRNWVRPLHVLLHIHHLAAHLAGGHEQVVAICRQLLDNIDCYKLKVVRVSCIYMSTVTDDQLAADLSPTLAELVGRAANSLQVVDFQQLRWTHFDLVMTQVLRLHQLHHLDLFGCQTEGGFHDLQLPDQDVCRNLVYLDVEQSGLHPDITNWMFRQLGSSITELYMWSMDSRTALRQQNVHHLNRMVHLRAATLSVTRAVLYTAGCALCRLKMLETLLLRVVDDAELFQEEDNCFLDSSPVLPRLRHLGVVHNTMSVQSAQYFCTKLGANLQTLVIQSSSAAHRDTLETALKSSPHLLVLSISGGTEEAVDGMARHLVLQQNLEITHEQLKYLNFDSCEHMSEHTRSVCDFIKRKWPNVHVPGVHFSEDILQQLKTKISGCGALKILQLLN